MRRRDFIKGIAGSATAWPLAARAQQLAMPVIGLLNSRAPGADPFLLDAFRSGLKDTGFIEGQNVGIEYRFGENHNERLPALAADLLKRRVAVIFANGPAAMAVKTNNGSIPMVFAIGFDPVQQGLVASMNHPGGNATGAVTSFDEIGPKKLELAHELVPLTGDVAALLNPSYSSTPNQTKDLEAAAQRLGLRLHVLNATRPQDLEVTLSSVAKLGAGALVIGNDPFFNSRSAELGAMTAANRVPGIFQTREFATAGGLISYGPSLAESYRTAGTYVGRILKGENPASLPVQESTEFDLVVNRKAAKAIGLDVPTTLLLRAREVIE